jgi:hypothetical protein
MQRSIPIAIGAALLSLALGAMAQKPSSYPAKGQTAELQKKDDGECLAWAKQTTGIDPAQPAPPPAQTPPPQGGRVKGAAAGAAVGAIGGNDVGNAAVKGAVVGGVAQRNKARGQQQQAAAQSQQAGQQNMAAYYNAYGACMTGRGYTVK